MAISNRIKTRMQNLRILIQNRLVKGIGNWETKLADSKLIFHRYYITFLPQHLIYRWARIDLLELTALKCQQIVKPGIQNSTYWYYLGGYVSSFCLKIASTVT